MKKKLITVLMAIFMVVPIVGCGEPDLSASPTNNQAKIILQFAEEDSSQASGYQTNQASLKYDYSDCADLIGSGFYKSGDYVNLGINYNTKACTHVGKKWFWFVGTTPEFRYGSTSMYQVNSANLGKTMYIYAVIDGKPENGTSLNASSTKFEFNGVTIKEHTYENLYTLSSDQVTIDGTQYTLSSDKKSFTWSGGSSNILADDTVPLKNGSYTVVRNPQGDITGIAKGISGGVPRKIDDDELENYYFAGNSADSTSVSFKEFIDTNLKGTNKEQGTTLGALSPSGSNLSYYVYYDTATTTKKLQEYKITWKYAVGSCGNLNVVPKIAFDPATQRFSDPEVCLAAEIDTTTGITNSFLEDAVYSTFYNQAYVDTNNASSCIQSATKNATVSITDTCMLIKNIGGLTEVTRKEAISLADSSTYYYALNKDSLNRNRLEGFETRNTGTTLLYMTLGYKADGTPADKYQYITYTNKTIEQMRDFNMKITPLYEKLLSALNSPATYRSSIKYTYVPATKSIAVKSFDIGGTTYYFNYVSGTATAVYAPPTGGYTFGVAGQEPSSLYSLVFDIGASDPDKATLENLKSKILFNPNNLIGSQSTVKKNIEDLIYQLVNGNNSFKDLKKYLFTVASDNQNKTVTITYENMLINPDDIDDYQYAVDSNTNIYTFAYSSGAFQTVANATSYNSIIESINYLISNTNLKAAPYWVKFIKQTSYVEYQLYQAESSTNIQYRFRYHKSATEPKFEVYDTNTLITTANFRIILAKSEGNKQFSALNSINNSQLTLTNNYNYVVEKININNTVLKASFDGKKYVIDVRNSKVLIYDGANHLEETVVLNNNIGTLRYYFVSDGIYYGIFNEGGAIDPYLYKINANDGTKIDEGTFKKDLTGAIYVVLDGEYHELTADGDNYKLVVGNKPVICSGTQCTIPVAAVVVKLGDTKLDAGDNRAKDINDLFTILTTNDSINKLTINSKEYYLVKKGNVNYVLRKMGGVNTYEIQYDGTIYTVVATFVDA